jgi:hypothetical protein
MEAYSHNIYKNKIPFMYSFRSFGKYMHHTSQKKIVIKTTKQDES